MKCPAELPDEQSSAEGDSPENQPDRRTLPAIGDVRAPRMAPLTREQIDEAMFG